jgi:hypothetical protein
MTAEWVKLPPLCPGSTPMTCPASGSRPLPFPGIAVLVPFPAGAGLLRPAMAPDGRALGARPGALLVGAGALVTGAGALVTGAGALVTGAGAVVTAEEADPPLSPSNWPQPVAHRRGTVVTTAITRPRRAHRSSR